MDQIMKFGNSLMGLLSPAKRRHTILPSTPPDKATTMQRPMQPTTEPRNHKQRTIIAGRVNKKYLSPSDTKRPIGILRKRKYEDDEHNQKVADHLESATLGPEDSSSQIQCGTDSGSAFSAILEEPEGSDVDPQFDDDEESELDAESKVHQFLDRQSELSRRQETLDRLREGEWHEDEKALLQKLSMRGFEPLLPSHWSFDFRTCPRTIFSSKDEETFLNSKSGNDFRATTALESLITLGCRVRALMYVHKPQEKLIKKELENYMKWAERDGGYASRNYLPILYVEAGRPNQDLPTIAKSISDQLSFLALRHRQDLAVDTPGDLNDLGEVVLFRRPPPLLYGIVISHFMVVVLTLDAGKAAAKPKNLAHFDLSDGNMDVWNGFGLAIVLCMVRNQLMAIKDEMESEMEDEESDPDR